MSTIIQNPSRGAADPGADEPSNVKAVDPLRVSLRDSATFVNMTTIQMAAGFARVHSSGSNYFDRIVPRTRLGSIYQTGAFSGAATFSLSPPAVTIEKTSDDPQGSTYFTSVDGGARPPRNAAVSAIMQSVAVNQFTMGDDDPVGPVLVLEHGPKKTAVFVFLLEDNLGNPIVRVCGPSVDGVRAPDAYYPSLYGVGDRAQYVIIWNEVLGLVQVFTDDSLGAGIVADAVPIASIPTSSFQQFGSLGSTQRGTDNDISAYYGVEGANGNSVAISNISVMPDIGFPFVNGARTGGWKTYLDSDISMGFSGAVDPTRLKRGGAWFVNPAGSPDPLGSITPVSAGFSRLTKRTAATSYTIYRHEEGFSRTATDGLAVEFRLSADTTGGPGASTGVALKISDGQTLFQLDFFDDGAVRNVGLLKNGGDPTLASDHFVGVSAIDYDLQTMRLVADPRRGYIDLYNTNDLTTPVASWPFDRALLPTTSDLDIEIGHVATGLNAVGVVDIYSLKYSYIYQSWETRDGIAPDAADPPYTGGAAGGSGGPLDSVILPGVVPLAYVGGGGSSGTGTVTDEGYKIVCAPGETLFFTRTIDADSLRGGIFEASLKISDWHPAGRSGSYCFLDDGVNTYMLSFVETDIGKFVCIPLSAGAGDFQESAGQIGDAAKLSVLLDWTEFHTYRLERRPRDGVYLFIDNNPVPALVLLDTARYSFPLAQFSGTPTMGFGAYSDEGGTSVWKFVRDFFGSGYELSTMLNQSEVELRRSLNNARATVVVTAGF